MTELTKPFDPKQFSEELEARVRREFVNMLPDEAFRSLVEGAIRRFTEPTVRPARSHAGTETLPSAFDEVVRGVLREHIEDETRAAIREMRTTPMWADGVTYYPPSEALVKLVTDNAGAIVPAMMAAFLQPIMQRILNDRAF